MNSREILLSDTFSYNELSELVRRLGGDWQDDDTSMIQGHFSDNNAWVFLRGAATQEEDIRLVSDEDIEYGKRICGQVKAVLTVDFSKTEESKKMADMVCEALLKERMGVVIE